MRMTLGMGSPVGAGDDGSDERQMAFTLLTRSDSGMSSGSGTRSSAS